MTNKRRFYRNIAVGFVVFFLAFLVIMPNLLVFIASFMTIDPNKFVAPPFTIDNYLKLFDPVLFKLIMNSMKIAVGATVFCLVFGYPFAYMVATAGKNSRPLLLVFIIIPFWTNSLIRNYALIIMLSANGVINKVLMSIGIIGEPIQMRYNYFGVFVGMAYTLLPFMILPLYSSIEKMDLKLLEAGRDLGASFYQVFTKIMLPQTMPGIIAGVILVFLPALSMFYVSDILGGENSRVIGNIIKDRFLKTREWPMGSAISILLTLIMIFLYFFYLKRSKKSKLFKFSGGS